MGKSASGKDHIYARLAAHEGLGLKKLVLYTTRPIRAEEENGKQYYFVDDKKLEDRIYTTKVEVYKAGAAEKGFPKENLVVTLDGTKED